MVESGAFSMAWVGWDDPASHEVRVASRSGDRDGYLEGLRVRSDETPLGQGPTGQAIREGRPVVLDDFPGTPDAAPWHAAAIRCGFASSASFPFRLGGAVVGALMVYAPAQGFFGPMEVALMEAAAGDVSFALDHLELEARRREAEAALRESEARLLRLNAELERRVRERTLALEAANQELEAFSYSVSHDLRAPLRTIDGFSQVLLEDYQDLLDEEGQRHLARIRGGTLRMGQLIDDLLKLSRTHRGELSRTACDLSGMCLRVLEGLAQAQPERRVEVRVQPGLGASADPSLLRAVLENLLGNAWKYTSRREGARIEAGEAVSDQGERSFFIRDNGVGFDMDQAGQLFRPFQRLHAASEYEGHGIGLAIVQRIVHRHGGRVWAQAEPERGATFHFTLPD
jgi:signal transduction histidine kinase